jgi:hypothetical protein
MSLDSFELIILTVSFLLPGYIIDLILRAERIRKSEESQIAFFRWLVLGTISNLPWLVIGFAFLAPHWDSNQELWDYVVDHRGWFVIAWVSIVFVWPVIVGRGLVKSERAYVRRRHKAGGADWSVWFAGFIGRMVATQGPINDDSSWDTKFSNLDRSRGQWVLVELVDGDWIAGVFGEGSESSVDPNERDLYIADVRYTSFDARFPGLESQGGILIPPDQIKRIHFWE